MTRALTASTALTSRRRHRSLRLAVAVVPLAVAAGCTGDGAATPTAAPAGSSSPSPPSTSGAPSTVPTTITTMTTTTTTTSVPPNAPTSTAAPDDALAEQIVAAAEDSFDTFNQARLDPTSDAKVAAMEATHTGEALAVVQQLIADYRSNGKKVILLERFPSALLIDSSTATIDLTAGTASVEVCYINTDIVVQIGAGPNGDRVIDDAIASILQRRLFVLESERWKLAGAERIELFEGAVSCGE